MCVCVCVSVCVCVRVCAFVCVRERETHRDTQRETERHRQTDKGGGGKERQRETAAARCALYVSLFIFCNGILTFGP